MTTETISIYLGRWGDRDYVFALNEEQAKSIVTTHFAFGDPLEDEYAVGNHWASGDQDTGWRIVEIKATVPVTGVKINASDPAGTSHVIWQCPYCERFYSDDWQIDDKVPVLLGCGCKEGSKYLLGLSEQKQESVVQQIPK